MTAVLTREELHDYLVTDGGCTPRSARDAIQYLTSGNPIICDDAAGGAVRITRRPDGTYEVAPAFQQRDMN